MKSILQEASSIEKAIKLAWENAGQPKEFSIKILEFGEKGFLGLTKKEAVISLAYESSQAEKTTRPKHPERHKGSQPRKPISEKAPRPLKEQQVRRPSEGEEPAEWTPELVEATATTLKEMLSHIGAENAKIASSVSGKTLALIVGDLPSTITDEHGLWASSSYLLLQIVKRRFRRKLHGFRLRIDSANKKAEGTPSQ